MSWAAYITSMKSSSTLSEACIAGLDGNVWAKSDGINPSPQELQTIIQAFNNADILRQNGVHLGGQKYFFLQSDDSQIQAKKATSGVSIAKANTCILIGLYKDGQVPGNCRKTVDAMRDYLVQNKY
ncbi:hypothetical protein LSH36_621g00014 [Paralvinella palmiformis]|uniref:Profilin n=1 Tax=Paralvinella palmiformis TaxID=53620 RepID=A0AAD9J5K0_9ANNE|nr:hypothetical protein LSH36_621g00014 [Paralvinella palmiformis]